MFWGGMTFEFLTIAGLACIGSTLCAGERFCESCEEWYSARTVFTCHGDARTELLASVRATDWEGAQSLCALQPPGEGSRCEAVVNTCLKCRSREVTVKATIQKRTAELFFGSLPFEAGERLSDLTAPKTP